MLFLVSVTRWHQCDQLARVSGRGEKDDYVYGYFTDGKDMLRGLIYISVFSAFKHFIECKVL